MLGILDLFSNISVNSQGKKKWQTAFRKFQNKTHFLLPNFWEAMLCFQDFSDSNSFLFNPGPTIYQSFSLIWTLPL